MIRKVMPLALMAVLIFPGLAVAADPPDLKGRWIGKTHSIIAGKGGHWPSSAGTFEKPLLGEKDLVIEITGQQDRRFWGNQTISGGGEKTEEPMIGELFGKDNQKILLVDTDGYLWGDIDGDVLTFCYGQASSKDRPSVVSCSELKRTR